MKRFLLFAGDFYYPNGGWDDFKGDFDSVENAKDWLEGDGGADWAHVIDTTTSSRAIII